MAAYVVVLERCGLTLGKSLLGLRVVDLECGHPGLWRSLARNGLQVVDSLPTSNIACWSRVNGRRPEE